MSQTTPIRQLPDSLAKAIVDLCVSARRIGRTIDIADEAARLAKEFPDAELGEGDLGEALVRECVMHHGVTVKLNGREV